MSLIFLVIAIVCFGGVVVFGAEMHSVEEVHRFLAAGLAAFAAAHIGWPSNWGPGPRA